MQSQLKDFQNFIVTLDTVCVCVCVCKSLSAWVRVLVCVNVRLRELRKQQAEYVGKQSGDKPQKTL